MPPSRVSEVQVSYDLVIVGGGVIGSAIAYFLKNDPSFAGSVLVLEPDPTYKAASSALSASSIRQQFSTPTNIAVSQFGIEFLRRIDEHLSIDGEPVPLGLTEHGYLYLASDQGEEVLRANNAVQRAHDVDVALLDPAQLVERFPWLSTEGVVLGSLGLTGEGWFDGYSLLQGFRRKARALGAEYRAAAATGFEMEGGRITAVRLDDGTSLACGTVVNAAGPRARAVAAMAGLPLPVEARRRSVFVFDCKTRLERCPLLIDTSGVYFRPEGDRFICGVSPAEADDPERFELEVDHSLFEEVIWPTLAARVPAFEEIRPGASWAGHYEYNTFDHNALLGPHPDRPNLIFANGFSGHGMQQSPAVGRGIAELVAHGSYRSLDLSALEYRRLLDNRPVLELNII